MLSRELLQEIKHLELKAGHLATAMLSGEYSSAFKGRGMEFDEVRAYVPGDDVRWIDWHVTARTGEPHVKLFREERQLTLMLLVDVSPSLDFGTTGRSKRTVASELAAVLAFLAQRNQDQVGLLIFSDHVEAFVPPRKGRAHVWNIIRHVLSHRGRGQRTDLDGALKHFLQMVKRRSLCFMISDFNGEMQESTLRLAGKRHEFIAARILDPREEEMPPVGLLPVRDLESGFISMADVSDPHFQKVWRQTVAHDRGEWQARLRRAGAEFFDLSTADAMSPPLARFLRQREKRRVRS